MLYVMYSKFAESVTVCNDAMKAFPEDIEFYYLRANSKRLMSVADPSDAINDLRYYLANADKEEETVTHCKKKKGV